MISHLHRCAYVHVPKTGGSSIELALTGHDWITGSPAEFGVYREERSSYTETYGGTLCANDPSYFRRRLAEKHASQAEIRNRLGEERWRDYFTFAFVRNPWRRLLSIHAHAQRDAPGCLPPRFATWLAEAEPLDHMGQPIFCRHIDRWSELDFVGRFESLERDYALVAGQLGLAGEAAQLPHEAHGSDGNHLLEAYDAPARRRVASFFAEEIELFDYGFDEPTSSPSLDPDSSYTQRG